MPNIRKVLLTNDESYHIFNRSVGNLEIFTQSKELQRFLELVEYYRFPQKIKYSQYKRLSFDAKDNYAKSYRNQCPLVEIYAFSVMPTHYHLLCKQKIDNGIKLFVSNFQNAYAKYFNKKSERGGSLFRNPFKSKWIENDEILLHVSRYIHLNPVTSFMVGVDDIDSYPWTSYPKYFEKIENNLINIKFVLKVCGSKSKYKKFVENQADYQRRLAKIRHTIIE